MRLQSSHLMSPNVQGHAFKTHTPTAQNKSYIRSVCIFFCTQELWQMTKPLMEFLHKLFPFCPDDIRRPALQSTETLHQPFTKTSINIQALCCLPAKLLYKQVSYFRIISSSPKSHYMRQQLSLPLSQQRLVHMTLSEGRGGPAADRQPTKSLSLQGGS